MTAQSGQGQVGENTGRGVWAGIEKPRGLSDPKKDAWTRQGVREGFLEEVVHELMGISNMKRRKRYARQEEKLWAGLVVKVWFQFEELKNIRYD